MKSIEQTLAEEKLAGAVTEEEQATAQAELDAVLALVEQHNELMSQTTVTVAQEEDDALEAEAQAFIAAMPTEASTDSPSEPV